MERPNWEMILAGPTDRAKAEIAACRHAATLRTLVDSGLLIADGRREAARTRLGELDGDRSAAADRPPACPERGEVGR